MTITKPTLADAKRNPVGFALGFILGFILLSVFNLAVGALVVFLGLNLIGGFGLAFWQVVGLGFLYAGLAPTAQFNASA